MKKLLSTAALLAALTTSAQAQEFKPYVGFDLQRSLYTYNDNIDLGGGAALNGNTVLNDGLNGFNVHVGNRFTKYLGAEFGGFYNREANKSIANGTIVGPGPTVAGGDFSTSVRTYGLTLDGLGYLPLNDKFDLIGTAGVTWTKAEAKIVVPGVGTGSDSTSELGLRGGAGAQVNLTDKISVRGLVRYQTADFDDVAEHAWTYSLGLNYGF